MDDDLLPLLTVGYLMHRQQEDDDYERKRRQEQKDRTALPPTYEDSPRNVQKVLYRPAGPDPRLTAEPQTISM